MRGDLIFKILEILESAVFTTADLLDVFTSGYSESYRKAQKIMIYGPQYREPLVNSWRERYEKNKRFYNLLYRLEKQGLIQKNKARGQSSWLITKKGKEKLNYLREWQRKLIPKRSYKIEKSGGLKIVIFDIPEKYRHKRRWLRDALARLNFSLLQKSVWAGKSKLPQNFLADLKEFEILSYVEIFSVNKTGSIKQVR